MPYADPEKARAWRAANKERLAAKKAAEYQANKEIIKARSRQYHEQNKEAVTIAKKAYYERNKQAFIERKANWRKENRDKFLAQHSHDASRRRAIAALATPKWANSDKIRAVYALARLLTDVTDEEHHVDHIVPLRSPIVCGLHVEYNMRVIPASDNLKKSNRLTDEQAS